MSEELIVKPQTAIEQDCQNSLLSVLAKNKKTIDAVLGKILDPRRFAYLAVQSIRANPNLAGCTPSSFINSVMLASQMGLEIRRDSAYLIPFGKECQLLIDYKGKLSLARRSGKVGGIQAVIVRENDEFEWRYDMSGVVFSHKPDLLRPEQRGRPIGVYAFAQLQGGGVQFREPMSLPEIERIRKRSRAGVSSMSLEQIWAANEIGEDGKMVWQSWAFRDPRRQPWVTDWEPMSLKSALHSLCKSLPLDPAAQLGQEVDDGFDTGKQPNILADAGVIIDPADDRPMVETVTFAEHPAMVEQRVEAVRAQVKNKPDAASAQAKQWRDELEARRADFTPIAFAALLGYERIADVPASELPAVMARLRESSS